MGREDKGGEDKKGEGSEDCVAIKTVANYSG
jgi:hypothetical protein